MIDRYINLKDALTFEELEYDLIDSWDDLPFVNEWTTKQVKELYDEYYVIPKIGYKEFDIKHGKWELHGNDDDCGSSYFCSNCGKSYDEDWFYIHGEYIEWNFCPNCGTDMRGDIHAKDN